MRNEAFLTYRPLRETILGIVPFGRRYLASPWSSIVSQRGRCETKRSNVSSPSGDDTWHLPFPASSLREDDAKRSVLTYRLLRETILGIVPFGRRYLASPWSSIVSQRGRCETKRSNVSSTSGDDTWHCPFRETILGIPLVQHRLSERTMRNEAF